MSEEYNGWRTYETWCVHLWITGEEPSYRHWDARARAQDTEALREELEAHYAESLDLLELPGVFRDLLSGSLREVDWREIAEALREGMDEDEDEDEEGEA